MDRRGPRLEIRVLAEKFSVCRLGVNAPLPGWAVRGAFFSITRTGEELSVICPEAQVPPEIVQEKNWRCLKIQGPLDFSAIGVLASLAVPLAREGISIFVLSTYDTDYLLVKEEKLGRAVAVLAAEGHEVKKSSE